MKAEFLDGEASSPDNREAAVAADRPDTVAGDTADTAGDTAERIADIAEGIADTLGGIAAEDIADIAAGSIADTAERIAGIAVVTGIVGTANIDVVPPEPAAPAGLRSRHRR